MENERLQARLQAAKLKAEALKLSAPWTSPDDTAQASTQTQQASFAYSHSGSSYSYSFSSQSPMSGGIAAGSCSPYNNSTAASTSSTAFAAVHQLRQDDADTRKDLEIPRKKVMSPLVQGFYFLP